jgi:hypothetical protein
MKNQVRCVLFLGVVAACALAASSTAAHAEDADPTVQKNFEKLLGAIKTADLEAFIANGTDTVQDGTTQKIMDTLKKTLGTRLEKGYKATYLCQLKQAGHQMHLWKLTFKDDGDDVVVRLALKDGKLAGFFLQ